MSLIPELFPWEPEPPVSAGAGLTVPEEGGWGGRWTHRERWRPEHGCCHPGKQDLKEDSGPEGAAPTWAAPTSPAEAGDPHLDSFSAMKSLRSLTGPKRCEGWTGRTALMGSCRGLPRPRLKSLKEVARQRPGTAQHDAMRARRPRERAEPGPRWGGELRGESRQLQRAGSLGACQVSAAPRAQLRARPRSPNSFPRSCGGFLGPRALAARGYRHSSPLLARPQAGPGRPCAGEAPA